MNPSPGSKADAVFRAICDLPAGKSAFFFMKEGKAIAHWTLNHEIFMVDGELNMDGSGEMASMTHLNYWQQPDERGITEAVRGYENQSEKIFSITKKKPHSRMLRIQRVI